ncbi:MAG: hypothetical protein FWD16_08120 [Clostridia bacterium]|nr:hypothetical protein [Clostridia bacterium]
MVKKRKKITVQAEGKQRKKRLAKAKRLRRESPEDRRERVAQSKKLRPAIIPDKKRKLREKAEGLEE